MWRCLPGSLLAAGSEPVSPCGSGKGGEGRGCAAGCHPEGSGTCLCRRVLPSAGSEGCTCAFWGKRLGVGGALLTVPGWRGRCCARSRARCSSSLLSYPKPRYGHVNWFLCSLSGAARSCWLTEELCLF